MFDHLAVYRRILVTGPPRSGTTIAGKMIARDTGHRYLDETVFKYREPTAAAWQAATADLLESVALSVSAAREVAERLRRHPNYDFLDGCSVVQCPAWFKMIVDNPPSDALVVLIRRDIDDIHASARRIGMRLSDLGWDDASRRDYPKWVYDYWESRPKPARFLEVDYASLSSHSLFVPKSMRAGFTSKQTVLDG